ncbi:MAG: helix-hairpin-helix domain-containing protein [Myxococcales bacterium]|nr:helix-hairpin-helix domain-containing protein [Myxococcales bacterium]
MHILLGAATLVAVASSPPRLILNEATSEQLAAVDGVDAATASAIVALRARRGRLGSVEELRTLGLDDEVLSSLRSSVSVQVELPDLVTGSFESPEEVLAQFADEPTIQQVHAWANHYAKSSPRQVDRWLRQSVTFATLPQVTLEWRLRDDWDQGFDYLNVDGAELLPDESPFPVINDAGQGQVQEVRVRLVFDLDKLVMSSERIRVINEAQDIVKLRDKVLAEATRLYFERRRLQAERLLAPKADTLARVQEELRILELTANLDALTGGAFSGAVNGSAR